MVMLLVVLVSLGIGFVAGNHVKRPYSHISAWSTDATDDSGPEFGMGIGNNGTKEDIANFLKEIKEESSRYPLIVKISSDNNTYRSIALVSSPKNITLDLMDTLCEELGISPVN